MKSNLQEKIKWQGLNISSVLVTGGAGYIGSHCAKLLKSSGYNPIVIDNLSRGARELVKFGLFYEGDCRDTSILKKIFSENEIAGVLHLAGYAYVEESVRNPSMYFVNNVGSTLALLEVMDWASVSPLVFSSTCTVYGSQNIHVTEESLLDPQCPYSKSKLVCENLIRQRGESTSISSVILRYFNVAGADRDLEIGEIHEPETHILPRMIEAARTNGKFTVYGGDFPTPDGSCIRDYVHVSDIAWAHVLSMRYLLEGGNSQYYNLSTGRGISNLQLVEQVEKQVRRPFSVQVGPRRPGDVPSLVGSAEKIYKDLGWEPLESSIENIVNSAFLWDKIRSGQNLDIGKASAIEAEV